MDQEIKFCTTTDGVSIAYATLGSGPPLVYVNGWPGNLALEWEQDFIRDFLRLFASEFTLVRYDMRNTGLSERGSDDMTLVALMKDLVAVIDHLELQDVALMSLGLVAGPLAITFAAERPERVSRLVLLGPYLRGERMMTEDQYKAMQAYVAAFGQLVTPDDARSSVQHLVDRKREQRAGSIHEASTSPRLLTQLLEVLYRADLTEALNRIDTPALVLHGSGDNRVNIHGVREVAARLRNSRFQPYEGLGYAPWADVEIIMPEIFEFLGAPPPQIAAKPKPQPVASLATILFTDIADSTALTLRLGDAEAQELVRAHNLIVRGALASHGGSEIKHTGDGIMASFPTASSALECAVEIQRAVAERDDQQLHVHVGLNAGEPVAEEEDLFGTAVQLARRICDHASAGQVVVSNVVRELAAGKGFMFADVGEVVPKGFEEPVRLYEVRWRAGS